MWRDRVGRKKVISSSRERLQDLFREARRRDHRASRPAQKHAARFSFPQQIADVRGRAAWGNAQVLETHRARRADAETVAVAAGYDRRSKDRRMMRPSYSAPSIISLTTSSGCA